jgi:RimJ/RimL family protein N-acetyltransferase
VDIGYRSFTPSDADSLARFLAGESWPFHGTRAEDRDAVLRRVTAGHCEGAETRTFWITEGDERVGLIRLLDLGDDTPMFDLRIRARHRGQGLGSRALAWLTGYLFTEFPGIRRIEGTTRQDNRAMRRTFLRCGYAKEALGYAVLRRDWAAGTVTRPRWDDEQDAAPPD